MFHKCPTSCLAITAAVAKLKFRMVSIRNPRKVVNKTFRNNWTPQTVEMFVGVLSSSRLSH